MLSMLISIESILYILFFEKYFFLSIQPLAIHYVREIGLLQTLLPGLQETRIFALWSGCPRQDQQVLAQTWRILRTGGDRVGSSHGHDGPIYSSRERTKAHALQVWKFISVGRQVDRPHSSGRPLQQRSLLCQKIQLVLHENYLQNIHLMIPMSDYVWC